MWQHATIACSSTFLTRHLYNHLDLGSLCARTKKGFKDDEFCLTRNKYMLYVLYVNYNANRLLLASKETTEDTHMICYFVDLRPWFVLEVRSLRPENWDWSSSLKKKEKCEEEKLTYTQTCFSQLTSCQGYIHINDDKEKVYIQPTNYERSPCVLAPNVKFIYCGNTFERPFFASDFICMMLV